MRLALKVPGAESFWKDPARLKLHLTDPDARIQADAWDHILENISKLLPEEFSAVLAYLALPTELKDIPLRVQDSETRIHILTRLLAAQPWRSSISNDWFFGPFRCRSDEAFQESAVIAGWDRHHIRDLQALVELARTLSHDRAPKVSFHLIPLESPRWEAVRLNDLGAICFIGRPSMFKNCPLLSEFADKANLRFGLPQDSPRHRGKEVTPKSARAFHNIFQKRDGLDDLVFATTESPGRRTDYAIVQRFLLKHGVVNLTVTILAGATSLGTFAAARWVTSGSFHGLIARYAQDVVRGGLDLNPEFEALLEVTAPLPREAAPWNPEQPRIVKLFFADGVNAVKTISRITIKRRPWRVLLDDDDVRFSEPAYGQLLALCKQAVRSGGKEIPLASLVNNAAFETANGRTDKVAEQIRGNLKKYKLRDALSISRSHVRFNVDLSY